MIMMTKAPIKIESIEAYYYKPLPLEKIEEFFN